MSLQILVVANWFFEFLLCFGFLFKMMISFNQQHRHLVLVLWCCRHYFNFEVVAVALGIVIYFLYVEVTLELLAYHQLTNQSITKVWSLMQQQHLPSLSS